MIPVGSRLKFHGDHRWWTVRATDDRFTIAVRQAAFQPKGVLCYTIVDAERGVRGPCNLIGQSFGDGSYSVEECEHMLRCLNAEREPGPITDPYPIEVSHRNNVPTNITALEP